MIEPGQHLGPFVIERELGAGAMGTVYKATYTETGQEVAIKFIGFALAGNESALARFEREAEILKQLKHPHIVRLFATGRYKKTPFFAMEFVDGESLDRVMERHGRLPWQEVVRLGKQLCLALQHAHDKGIIHRDLKPSNLMILSDGTLKLTDFGIAKDTDVTALTGTNSTVGTAAYMSPEQCKGEKSLTNKSDLYSLGVVFYELLTGRKPFVKESPVDMFLAHVSEPFERPSRHVLDIPPWLNTLVCQLMEKKPEHRPFDAAMVKRVLDEVEDKMAEQRPAGLDVANARIADRPDALRNDAGDREAARALRAGKKKVRRKATPIYERNWFVATGVAAVLAGMATLGWWAMQPPSPTVLYDRAKNAMAAGNIDAASEATRKFLDAYPDRTDLNAVSMRQWHEKIATDRLETQMHNRYRRKLSPDGEQQKLVYAALGYEDEGNTDEARKRWAELAEHANSATTDDDRSWQWLALRKIKVIDQLPVIERNLIEARTQPDFKPAHDAERRAFLAVRYEQFGDKALASEGWAKIRTEFDKDATLRNYVILAASKAASLKGQFPNSTDALLQLRKDLLRKHLVDLDELLKHPSPRNLRMARSLGRDFAELYDKNADPEIATMIQQAAARVASVTRDKDAP